MQHEMLLKLLLLLLLVSAWISALTLWESSHAWISPLNLWG